MNNWMIRFDRFVFHLLYIITNEKVCSSVE